MEWRHRLTSGPRHLQDPAWNVPASRGLRSYSAGACARKEAGIPNIAASIRPVLPGFVIRTLVLWLLARTVFTAFNRASASLLPWLGPADRSLVAAASVTPLTALLIAAAVTALTLSDVRAVRERAFLANIGVSLRAVSAIAFAVALACEAVLAILIA